jgi:hypothetical protein
VARRQGVRLRDVAEPHAARRPPRCVAVGTGAGGALAATPRLRGLPAGLDFADAPMRRGAALRTAGRPPVPSPSRPHRPTSPPPRLPPALCRHPKAAVRRGDRRFQEGGQGAADLRLQPLLQRAAQTLLRRAVGGGRLPLHVPVRQQPLPVQEPGIQQVQVRGAAAGGRGPRRRAPRLLDRAPRAQPAAAQGLVAPCGRRWRARAARVLTPAAPPPPLTAGTAAAWPATPTKTQT